MRSGVSRATSPLRQPRSGLCDDSTLGTGDFAATLGRATWSRLAGLLPVRTRTAGALSHRRGDGLSFRGSTSSASATAARSRRSGTTGMTSGCWTSFGPPSSPVPLATIRVSQARLTPLRRYGSPIRSGGQYRISARPMMFSRGTTPHRRESHDMARLSPSTK
jgi:hypothetical protein